MNVTLKNTLGILNDAGERVYYGPGEADVPDAYVQALGLEPAKDYAALNAKDFLAAVESGELSKADALKLEEGRAEPRKSVLEALKSE